MKKITLVFIFIFSIFYFVSAQQNIKRVNIYIFDNPEHKKFWSQTFYWRAKWHSFFSNGKMIAFRANSPQMAAEKVTFLLSKKKSLLGHLWLDSHGYYYNRRSSFYFGGKKVNFQTILDSSILSPLKKINTFCDSKTKITIGACFSSATFNFPDKDSLKGRPMNGDSLMLAMGNVFNKSTIYGCESWVMEGTGLWHGKYKLAGAPLQKRYKDVLFSPAWQCIGKWRKFNPLLNKIESCNTIGMNKHGDVFEQEKSFYDFKKTQLKISKNLKKLKPNLYKNKLVV